ncbi:hypothetical protein BJQ94_13650 [Cryobacterium sp. SO2]|uniref:hypothetical protein n=1 Tax=Cryobacterium sp. SO2 TaxID=1897060 RepID=UPI00223DC723|nr:hypothetical protein [Cryobacterium sp. SO2]WEO76404.1 hypothetical protein BJQ94_13650 [Cryobacterium sp. SO2]
MDETSDRAQTQRQLDTITARIDAHVLNSQRMTDARQVTAEHRDAGKGAVEQALSERGLPGAAEQGRALVFGLASLARLNRKRLRLETRIAAMEPDVAAGREELERQEKL